MAGPRESEPEAPVRDLRAMARRGFLLWWVESRSAPGLQASDATRLGEDVADYSRWSAASVCSRIVFRVRSWYAVM